MVGRLSNLFAGVAGRPAQSSYMWSGFRSPVTQVTVWVAAILRFVSPLQWLKYAYRQGTFPFSLQAGIGRGSRSAGSNRRIDVPPAFTDIYFVTISVLLGALLVLRSRWSNWGESDLLRIAIITLVVVLLVESINWIIYYFLLVRIGHVEEDFVIWSPAEYILLFPLQIWIQGAAIALIVGTSVLDASLLLVGQGSPTSWLENAAAFLSVAYLGILIAALLGSLRPMRSRKTQFWYIFGAGDVTERLILPALNRIGVSKSQRVVIDVRESKIRDEKSVQLGTGGKGKESVISSSKDYVACNPGIYVIASPTETHFRYLRLLQSCSRRGICEKPLTLDSREFDSLEAHPEIFDEIFCLSYYLLDKGLPLTYLFDPRIIYEQYLNFGDRGDDQTTQVLAKLGELRGLSFDFNEPITQSDNPVEATTLRELEDLVFHPFAIMGLILGPNVRYEIRPSDIEGKGFNFSPRGSLDLNIDFVAPTSTESINVQIHIERNPNVNNKKRSLICVYEHGIIEADFDNKMCTVTDRQGNSLWFCGMDDDYKDDYSAMFSMVHRWVHQENSPRDYDLLAEQMWATGTWIKIRDSFYGSSV